MYYYDYILVSKQTKNQTKQNKSDHSLDQIVTQLPSLTFTDHSHHIMRGGAIFLGWLEHSQSRPPHETALSFCRWCLRLSNFCGSHTVFLMRRICIEASLALL